jgi:hypothetical protein
VSVSVGDNAKIKCPKCKNTKNFSVGEHWTCIIPFSVVNGKIEDVDVGLEPETFLFTVFNCNKCRHYWQRKKQFPQYVTPNQMPNDSR